MLEGLIFIAVTAALAFYTTRYAAYRAVRLRPDASFGRQLLCALLGFPAAAVLLFAFATAVALIDGSRLDEPGPGAGMAVFAFVFFLMYALAIGAVVAWPTAIVTLRRLRRS